jgi:hypothetical protein
MMSIVWSIPSVAVSYTYIYSHSGTIIPNDSPKCAKGLDVDV